MARPDRTRAQPRLLLYGFSSFGAVRQNPSALAVRSLRKSFRGHARIQTAVFRVSYEAVKNRLAPLLEKGRFDLVIGLGVCAGSEEFRIETRASNQASSVLADADGKKKAGVISRRGPSFVRSSPGTNEIVRILNAKRFPAVLSRNAGDYLCNYAFYLTGLYARRSKSGVTFGFLHIPLHSEYADKKGLSYPGLPLKRILAAARLYVQVSIEQRKQQDFAQ